ncbi:MAG TPA: TlpA disulfide reductase family protein [Candidatus Binatia bacterium]|nr:TlpA disulfide reductase family protein [Candidatus Binatia bacterium]
MKQKAGANRAERRRQDRSGSAPANWGRWVAVGVTVLFAAIVAAIVVVNRQTVPRTASEAPIYAPLALGDPAPPFDVATIDGVRMNSQSIAQPIALEVFATWCPHCQKETQTLNALHQRLGSRLAIVAVSGSEIGSDHTSAETLDDVRTFASYFRVTYPIAYDPDLTVAKHYLQGGFPTIVFIDRQKRIVSVDSGEVPLSRLEANAKKAGVSTNG